MSKIASRTIINILMLSSVMSAACAVMPDEMEGQFGQPDAGADETDDPPVKSLNRMMLAGDPNLDPDWDWTEDAIIYLYTTEPGFDGVATVLPYYSATGPALRSFVPGDLDIKPEHGWRLVKRDFGTSTVATTSVPYFILYNDVRGLMRFFFFWTKDSYSFASVRLGRGNGQTALFTMGTESGPLGPPPFIDDYDPDQGITTIVEVNRGHWSVADFFLGYEPDPEPTDTIVFDIAGVDESKVELSGHQTIDMTVMSNGGTGISQTSSNPFQFFIDAQSYVVSKHEKAVDQIAANTKWAKKYPNNTLSKLINATANGAIGTYYPLYVEARAVYDYFNGGGGNADSQVVSNRTIIDFDLNLSGTITLERPEFTLTMLVPGNLTDDQTHRTRPLTNSRLGVYGVSDTPYVYFNTRRSSCSYQPGSWLPGSWHCNVTEYSKAIHTPVVEYNDDIQTPLASIDAEWGWVPYDANKLIEYVAIDTDPIPSIATSQYTCDLLFTGPDINPYDTVAHGCIPSGGEALRFMSLEYAVKVTVNLAEQVADAIPVTMYRTYRPRTAEIASQNEFDQLGSFDANRARLALVDSGQSSQIGAFSGHGYAGFFAQGLITRKLYSEAMQASHTPDGEFSAMEVTIDVGEGHGMVSYYWKVSSEQDADSLRFYIDNQEQARISGEVDWQPQTHTLSTGSHTLRWEYVKDEAGSGGQDTAWVDSVSFTNT